MRKVLLILLLFPILASAQSVRFTADTSIFFRNRLAPGEFGAAIISGKLYLLQAGQPPALQTIDSSQVNMLGKKLFLQDQDIASRTKFMTVSALQSLTTSSAEAPIAVNITTTGKRGLFVYDPAEGATDNGGTILVTASGLRYKRIFSGGVDAGWFCVGNGIADDRANLQAAIDYAASIGAHLFDTGTPTYRLTGTINLKSGLMGCSLSGVLSASGTGYTVVTTDTAFSWKRLELNIEGNSNAVNGAQLNLPLNSVVQAIRVHNCNGSGLTISRAYDTVFENISIESCGNDSSYAFQIIDGGDTSNMLNILRLQVELSLQKAIYISPNTLSCNINSIHSERQKVTGSAKDTWMLGGSNCTYTNVRLTARSDSGYVADSARAHLYGAMLTINDFRVEGRVPVVAESWAEGLAQVRINQINANYYSKAGNGDVWVNGGYIDNVSGISNRSHFHNVILDSLVVGYSPSSAYPVELHSCWVKHLSSSSTDSHLRAYATTIEEGTFCQGTTYLSNCLFTIGTQTPAYRIIRLNNTQLTGNLTTDNGHIEFLNGSRIIGNFTVGPNRSVIFDASSYVTGTVTNMGPPEDSTYAGGFSVGQRIWNPAPTPTGTEFWTCTTATASTGDPGTWTAH